MTFYLRFIETLLTHVREIVWNSYIDLYIDLLTNIYFKPNIYIYSMFCSPIWAQNGRELILN